MEKTIMDVSRHQGVIDWAKVKASGNVFFLNFWRCCSVRN